MALKGEKGPKPCRRLQNKTRGIVKFQNLDDTHETFYQVIYEQADEWNEKWLYMKTWPKKGLRDTSMLLSEIRKEADIICYIK